MQLRSISKRWKEKTRLSREPVSAPSPTFRVIISTTTRWNARPPVASEIRSLFGHAALDKSRHTLTAKQALLVHHLSPLPCLSFAAADHLERSPARSRAGREPHQRTNHPTGQLLRDRRISNRAASRALAPPPPPPSSSDEGDGERAGTRACVYPSCRLLPRPIAPTRGRHKPALANLCAPPPRLQAATFSPPPRARHLQPRSRLRQAKIHQGERGPPRPASLSPPPPSLSLSLARAPRNTDSASSSSRP